MLHTSLSKGYIALIISFVILSSIACKQDASGGAASTPAADGELAGFILEAIPGSSVQSAKRLDGAGNVQIEGFVENGKKTGQWIEYTGEGDISKISHYVNGLLEGTVVRMSFRNQADQKSTYKQNKLDGQLVVYKFGRMIESRFYKNDKLDGTAITYDDRTFKVKQEVQYRDGLQDGYFKYYDEEGNVTLEYQYKKGEKLSGGIVEPKK